MIISSLHLSIGMCVIPVCHWQKVRTSSQLQTVGVPTLRSSRRARKKSSSKDYPHLLFYHVYRNQNVSDHPRLILCCHYQDQSTHHTHKQPWLGCLIWLFGRSNRQARVKSERFRTDPSLGNTPLPKSRFEGLEKKRARRTRRHREKREKKLKKGESKELACPRLPQATARQRRDPRKSEELARKAWHT